MKNRIKAKFKLVDIIILMTITSTLFYLLSKNLPIGIGSFRFVWGPFSLITILLIKPKVILKQPVLQLLLISSILIFLLFFFWDKLFLNHRNQIIEEFYNILIFSVIWMYYLTSKNNRNLPKICKFGFIFIIYTIIVTNVVLFIDPMIVRGSANGFDGNTYQLKLSDTFGVLGYGYAQAIVIFIPILVYHIKKNRNLIFTKKWLWTILILIIVTTLRAQVFANVLIMIVTLLMSFAGSKRKKATFRYASLLILFVVVIPSSFYINLLNTASQYFSEDSNTYYKLNDFAMFLENPELDTTTGAGGRAERYPILLEAFLENPIFGDASYTSNLHIELGAHVYWMYRLSVWGIFGFMFFLSMLYKVYKSIVNSIYDKEMKFYYFLSVLAFIMFGLIKNIAGREPWIFLIIIIPGLYLGTLEDIRQFELRLGDNDNVQK